MNKFWSSMVKRTQPYVPGEQVNSEDLLKLNTNENPYPPSPHVTKAIEEEMHSHLQLYPSPTADKLREVVAEKHNLTKEHVFIGNGSDEVLAFSFMAFFEPGEMIRFPNITYSFYPVYSKIFDVPYEAIPLQDDFTICPKDYFNAEGGVIFPNPNAPTSLYLELEAIEEILQQNSNQVVIIDEAYIDFAKMSATSLIEQYENLLVVQTTSKSRSLAGLRVGLALGQPHLIEALMRIKDSINSYTIDRLALVGATEAFLDDDHFIKTTNQIIDTRTKVSTDLEALGFTVLPSQTNFVFVTNENQDAKQLYEKLKADNILVRHFDVEPIQNYLRISIGTDEQMNHFMKKLKQHLD